MPFGFQGRGTCIFAYVLLAVLAMLLLELSHHVSMSQNRTPDRSISVGTV